MYGWLWRSLPERPGTRFTWMVVLIAAVLWFGVFPWLQLHVDGSAISN